MKTYQEEIGDLVALALTPPSMGSMGAGSATEDRLIDTWRATVIGTALDLHRRVLGVDPKAVRLVEAVMAEFGQ